MSAEKIFFNIFIVYLIWFVFNRYAITKKTVLLGVLFGQFFSFILSMAAMFNNIKPNLFMQIITSVFGIIVPGWIFVGYHFNVSKEVNNIYKRFKKWLSSIKAPAKREYNDMLMLEDGSKDVYGLAGKTKIVQEKQIEDLLKGYSCPVDEIPSSVKSGLGEAQKLLEAKAYRKALETYLAIERQCGDNAVLQFNIGNMYYNLKNYNEALSKYKKALDINEGFENPRGRQDNKSSHRTAARRIKNILKKVEDYEITFNMAECLLAQGKYERAIEMFKTAGEFKGNWINVYQPIATIYESLQRYPEALEMYKNLSEVNPEDFGIHTKVAKYLCEMGDYDQAKKYYDKAVKLKPNFSDGYVNLGNCLLEKKMYKEAIDIYEMAINITPDQSTIHYNRGIAFYGDGQEVKALGEYKKAIELNNNDYMSYYNLGVILDEMDKKEDAILAFGHCLDIKPDFYEASNNIAVILCTLERYKEAIDAYIKALQYNPSNHELYFNLAVTLEYQGQDAHAEELYAKIIKMKPDFSDAYFNLAIIRSNKGDLKNTEEYLRKVIEHDKNYHRAYYQLARVYAALREYGRCLDNLKKAIRLSREYVGKARSEQVFDRIRTLKGFESIIEG